MRKTEVYSWRMSTATKSRLEEMARLQQRTVAQLLDDIVAKGLDSDDQSSTDAERQLSLHSEAARFAGRITGTDPRRAENVRSLVRARLRRQARAR